MAKRAKSTRLHKVSEAIKNYINENLDKDLSLPKIADFFFISVSTACHHFKEDYGISIKQYILKEKMGKARELIKSGEKAQAVCETLGFENYSTFFRDYKKLFGISPSQDVENKNQAR